MKAELLKRCVRAMASVEDRDLSTLCKTVIKEERSKGHEKLADQLATMLSNTRVSHEKHAKATKPTLTPLPSASRHSGAPFVVRLAPEELRHIMVLDDSVEERFKSIEQEYAARERLAKHGLVHKKKILIYGPPGCGKTLGAERLAWHTGLPMVKVRFDTLISSYFGESASNLRQVFEMASREPCLLFLDECDYVAKQRRDTRDVGEASRIVNTLLQLLEDYDAPGLLVAATNLDEMLDHAVFRRFDDVFAVSLPGKKQIAELLELTLSAVPTDRHIFWQKLAEELKGMSAATVVQVAQRAAKQVILDGRELVHHEDLQIAITQAYRTRQQSEVNGASSR
jgi:SpoVK/Ycf46/Vps4 family AAA+-type ATPase